MAIQEYMTRFLGEARSLFFEDPPAPAGGRGINYAGARMHSGTLVGFLSSPANAELDGFSKRGDDGAIFRYEAQRRGDTRSRGGKQGFLGVKADRVVLCWHVCSLQ